MEIWYNYFPNVIRYADQFPKAILDTLLMLTISTIISFLIGLPLAIAVVLTKPDGLLPNKWIYWTLDKLINLFRSIPFIILIPMLYVLSRLIFGTTIGVKGVLVPLIVGTIPYLARQMESAIEEIPYGVTEASISMGFSPWQIVRQVYLKENIPGMIRGMTITVISLIGQIAIVGAVGAGGLGDLAIRFGWQRQMTDITYVVVFLILIIISLIQYAGNLLVRATTH